MSRPTHIYVIASPRPRVGKTLLARLFTEYYRSEGRPVAAFDVDPNESTLLEFLPGFAVAGQIADTRGQMALFDRLIVDDEKPKVVDVGSTVFDGFMKVMTEIDFVPEARRRSVEPVIMFVASPDERAIKAYDELNRRFGDLTLVPIYNEAIARVALLRERFPARGAGSLPLRVPTLSPSLRHIIDTRPFSFSAYRRGMSSDVPAILDAELGSWVKRVLLQFRELELRLLLDRLRLSLGSESDPSPREPG